MLSREIEKEIQQENKVLLSFTLRQAICLGIAVLCSVLIAVFLGLDFELAVYPCFVIGGICFAFGWIKQDGIPMERILLKRLHVYLYKNQVRVYRSKNKYITLLNQEYDHRRQVDLADKKLQRKLKKEKRGRKKAMKASKLKRME